MRKALVYVREGSGGQVGAIAKCQDANDQTGTFLLSDKWCELIDIPEGADESFLKTTLIEATEEVPAHWEVSEDLVAKFNALKPAKLSAIDSKTDSLIAQGGTYDGQVFSLSLAAQTNWHVLKTMQASFSWPKTISTKASGSYSLSEANLNAFISAMLGTVDGHIASGRTLKDAVYAATDLTELDAVVDAR